VLADELRSADPRDDSTDNRDMRELRSALKSERTEREADLTRLHDEVTELDQRWLKAIELTQAVERELGIAPAEAHERGPLVQELFGLARWPEGTIVMPPEPEAEPEGDPVRAIETDDDRAARLLGRSGEGRAVEQVVTPETVAAAPPDAGRPHGGITGGSGRRTR
jgi:hypothetical protein